MKSLLPVGLLALLGACSSGSDGNAAGDAGSTPGPVGTSPGADAGPDRRADGGASCAAPVDALRPRRDACSFAAGARATDTLGVSDAFRGAIPIKHVVVVMKENRSFDHLLGRLSKAGQPEAEPVPETWAPRDASGTPVPPFHATTTCVATDPPHQWDEMHAQANGGKMDGFVTSGASSTPTVSDGHFTMGYSDQSDLPFYYWLASTYALADRYFPSVLSGTWANRDYLVAATSKGTKNTQSDPQLDGVPIVFDQLDAAKVSWNVYTDDFAPLEFSVSWGSRKRWGKSKDFFTAAKAGKLPAVSFIDATTAFAPPSTDEHPPGDVQAGEAWTRSVYDAVVQGPSWADTALFFTYDEAGGFADHVPPPRSCAPSADQAEFTELGIRVPLIVISPWARRHFVSHAVHEHTSILRFIELLFDLPALTARDANSDALLDMFDFACPDTATLPVAPAAGTGACP
jgi:phospholipase C